MLFTKEHWDKVYANTESLHSWTQLKPETTLSVISNLNLSKEASIIDVGGGDSYLVDYLLDLGFKNITVLDISSVAIDKTKKRLGNRQNNVKWINSDILDFMPKENYDLWIDRATFHFLNNDEKIEHYKQLAISSVKNDGHLLIATFSKNGPSQCSGLNVKQYSSNELENTFNDHFSLKKIITEDHYTPNNSAQNFIYCFFDKGTSKNTTVIEEYVQYHNNQNKNTPDSCDITQKNCCCK